MGCLHLPAVTSCHLVVLQCLWKLKPLILESIYRTGFLFLRLLEDDLSLILHHAPKTSTGVLMGKPELAVIRDVTFLKKAWLGGVLWGWLLWSMRSNWEMKQMSSCSKCKPSCLWVSKHRGDFCSPPWKHGAQTGKITTFCNLREGLWFGLETSSAQEAVSKQDRSWLCEITEQSECGRESTKKLRILKLFI